MDNPPTFLEIDSIQLTGAEELAQGELSPRDIAVEVGPPGTLFAAPDFFSLGGPIGSPDSDVSRGAVGDIDGDGLLDIAMVAGNLPVGPALVVWLGQPNDIPAFEGYYPLPGKGNQVLTSDVNGDGDTDLIVLGTSPGSGHGSVFVLINQGTPATAVTSETAATPTAFALGANYPNPFNPATTIPLVVPAGAKNVDLTVYNVLGQPIPSVDGAATRWRAPANLGWPRRSRPTRRRWSLCVSVAGGRADAHPQNGQNRIDGRVN